MSTKYPVANVLNLLLWLGCQNTKGSFPIGSGVILNLDDNQYLVTALHVVENCDYKPSVRSKGKWHSIDWQTVVVSQEHDIAVLKTHTILDSQKIPVLYGEPKGLIFGQIGYALGYPGIYDVHGARIDHIIEAQGRPMPIVALVVANFTAEGSSTYSSSYINAGFSGGAIVFPLGKNDWTVAGIITHFPTVRRPVYRDGKQTGDYVDQHTGLVGYTSVSIIRKLILDHEAGKK